VARRNLILALGETQIGTGYARILDSLLSRLDQHFALEQVAFGCDPRPGLARRRIHILDESSQDAECRHLIRIVEDRQPAILLINHDLSLVARYLPVFERIRGRVRIVMYCPFDGPKTDAGVMRSLLRVHHVVMYTPEQADQVRAQLRGHATNLRWEDPPLVSAIGVGLDTEVFSPHESRRGSDLSLLNRGAVRRELFGSDDLRDAFIVLNANRNIVRKRIDLTVDAFARFAVGKPKSVLLWLHMAETAYKGWDLPRLKRRYHLQGRMIHRSFGRGLPSIPVDQLVLLYNACDVGVNTSVEEGWGLVGLEHGATGAAQIVPDHSVLPSLWRDSALRIGTYRSLVTNVPHQEEWTVDVQDLVNKLDLLYVNRILLAERSASALGYTRGQQFDWDRLVVTWRELLMEELKIACQSPGREPVKY
jgi:glycosyltransferase involved in cell wall biosynthesis